MYTGNQFTESVVGYNNTVFAGSGKCLYAIDGTTGKVKWTFSTGSNLAGPPSIAADGSIYFAADKFYALDSFSGAVKLEIVGSFSGSPAIGADSVVYSVSDTTKITAINGLTRLPLWVYDTGYQILTSPTIGTNGVLYGSTTKGSIFALNISSPNLMNGPWPMFHRNAQHTSRYDYTGVPHDLLPRQATATSQIINGFVVGVTITDGGFGYTNSPAVVFSGGGGTGATATSAIDTNGSVTSITVLNPGHGYTTAPTVVIAPPPFPPRQATANVQLANGFIVGAPLIDGGFGYSAPPRVRFIGGRGSQAAASSAIDSNGVVTGITVTNPGSGYNTNVQVVIDPPFIPNPTMTIAAINYGSLVTPIIQLDFGHLAPYNNYQIEFSPVAAGTWTIVGTYFIPTAATNTQFINATGKVGFFRVKYVP